MLDNIVRKWGALPLEALNDETIRGEFLDWRDIIATQGVAAAFPRSDTSKHRKGLKGSERSADYYIGMMRTIIQWAGTGENTASP
jgi:hypothetical protein